MVIGLAEEHALTDPSRTETRRQLQPISGWNPTLAEYCKVWRPKKPGGDTWDRSRTFRRLYELLEVLTALPEPERRRSLSVVRRVGV